MTQGTMDKGQKALSSAQLLLDAGTSDGATQLRLLRDVRDAAIAALSWVARWWQGAEPPQNSLRSYLGQLWGLSLCK